MIFLLRALAIFWLEIFHFLKINRIYGCSIGPIFKYPALPLPGSPGE